MRRALLALALVALAPASAFAWGGSPDWMKALVHVQLPAYPEDTKGVVLLDETTTTVTDSGEVREFRRVAIKILNSEGRDLGEIAIPYDDATRIKSLHAWTITAKGEEFQAADRDTMEVAAFEGELYADHRVKLLKIPASDPGNVIAYEYERRQRPDVLQDSWDFQESVPVRSATYTLVLPNGWSHEERWFNAAPVAPAVTGTTATWTVSGVAGVKQEPRRPTFRAVAGRMAINFVPPAQLASKSHRTWDDVARWYAALTVDRRAASPALQAKAAELVAGKTTTLDRITALGRFAQSDVRYVAIEIGIGGYQPHTAAEIFGNHYGDCKDKVTVLGAMLKSIGIDSYYVLASTDRGVIDPKFATGEGFNHAIIAIKLPDDVPTASLRAAIKHPKLGNLLLFDPTSESTPLGSLPVYLQDNDLLLVTDAGGDLIHAPVHPADATRLATSVKATLDTDGTLHGEVREVRTGWIGAGMRSYLSRHTEAERKQWIEKRLSYAMSQYQVSDLGIDNLDDPAKDLVVHYKFLAPQYARRAGGLMLLRPRLLGNKSEGVINLKDRVYGYESDGPSLEEDEVEITLPPGMTADELPDAVTAQNHVAAYHSETKVAGNVLHYQRQYRMDAIAVPRTDLTDLNGLFTKIVADERATAVLK